MGKVYAFDFSTVMTMASAMDIDTRFVAEVLPMVEPWVLQGHKAEGS